MQSSRAECSAFNPALWSLLPLAETSCSVCRSINHCFGVFDFSAVNHLLALLVAAAVVRRAHPSRSLASERNSIESTYELTKYLEYQLKEIKDVYLTYLGPPFNEKDFSPPRPNSTALTLPSAATRLELWHGLENQARLAQNQRAYSILLTAVRELARSTLCPSLKTSLLQFCTGLDGLLGSISALMTTLGYSSQSANMGDIAGELQYLQRGTGGNRPAPLMSQSLYRSRAGSRTESGQRGSQRKSGAKVIRGEREDGVRVDLVTRKKGKEGKRADVATSGGRSSGVRERGRGERGRRDKREEPERSGMNVSEKETAGIEEEAVERWGKRRLLSIDEDGGEQDRELGFRLEVSYLGAGGAIHQIQTDNSNQFSFNLNSHHFDTLREEDGFILEKSRSLLVNEEKQPDIEVISSFSHLQQRRAPRSLLSASLQPPVPTISLLYQFEGGEDHSLLPQTVPLSLSGGTSLLSPPSSLLSVRPTMNDFARKVEGFWILRELQSWLWRSAKDFNRLKRKLRA
ncbi:uncharacterized protein clcf1 [Cololabis saira]|uniref:uncharacterized protein clcf1 n=1 Tax=Cololabis saira TaxID=129043 RepID=UPI002AD1E07E|nr:uncharacterized protein clcf1 [Cololabis saira]